MPQHGTGTFTLQRQADSATGVAGATLGTFEGTILLRGRSQRHD